MMFMNKSSVNIRKDAVLAYKEIEQLVRAEKINTPGYAEYFKIVEKFRNCNKKERADLGKNKFSNAYKLHLSKFQREVTAAIQALVDYLWICHEIKLTLMIDVRLVEGRKFEVDCFIKELNLCYDIYGSNHKEPKRKKSDREKHISLKGLGYKVTIICPPDYGKNEESLLITSAENRCGSNTLSDVIEDILKEANIQYGWNLKKRDFDYKTREILRFMESDIQYNVDCFLVEWEVNEWKKMNELKQMKEIAA